MHFPTTVHSDEATFDIQFGNLKRKVHTNTSWDLARFETRGQKWLDFSEGHYGVSLLNDCKYGHSVRDGCIALTLETVKQAEDGDGWIVRLYETDNALTQTCLRWNRPIASAACCNCIEEAGEPVAPFDHGCLSFTIKPYEIKTFRIREA